MKSVCVILSERINVKLWIIVILYLIYPSLQCGPGTGGGRRRSRDMRPLIYKQHIPNVSENTLGASGMPEGRIHRTKNPEKFKELVVNRNPDIIFKDDEHTGNDRIMSQRCSKKLDVLAMMVRTQWPELKLRVIEAWDEDDGHSVDSLHYEGRAVDVTTSDRDRAKYGMLARLAVESGFDFVFYIRRSHIHCSVKSDSSEALRIGGCFPPSGMVHTREDGRKSLSNLNVGEHVQTLAPDGSSKFTEVVAFMDKTDSVTTTFVKIQTDLDETILLTSLHHIFRYKTLSSGNLTNEISSRSTSVTFDLRLIENVYAENIRRGDMLFTIRNNSLRLGRVHKISLKRLKGLYAPLTTEGTIIVDGIYVSCYALVSDLNLAHRTLAPYRLAYTLSRHYFPSSVTDLLSCRKSQNGMHWFTKGAYLIGRSLLSNSLLPAG